MPVKKQPTMPKGATGALHQVRGIGRAAIVAALLTLAACGGGSNGGSNGAGGYQAGSVSSAQASSTSSAVSSVSSVSSLSAATDSHSSAHSSISSSSSSMASVSSASSSFSSSSSSFSSVPATVRISGTVSYDYVPVSDNRGLDYTATRAKPVRLAKVYLLNAMGDVLDAAQTDHAGHYTLLSPSSTQVRVRVAAVSASNAAPRWEVRVEDNTSNNALYVLEGQLLSSGSDNSVRDLHAASGWTGRDYTEPRAAAPFAIMDSAYMAVQKLIEIDPNLMLPPSIFRWSVNNTTANGLLSEGDIGTSFYNGDAVYLLGQANVDTDEYDAHVVVHEWSHFFELRVGLRTNSIGGSHGGLDKLDMRLAFSEGFASGIAGYVLSDSIYKDSFSSGQGYSGGVDLSRKNFSNQGWFNESSIQTIFYHLASSGAFKQIYGVLTDSLYADAPAFTSIFSFADIMATRYPVAFAVLDDLMTEQNIASRDQFGAGETNNGGTNGVLPLYVDLQPDGSPQTVCSTQVNGAHNKLGVHKFFKTSILNAGSYQLLVENNGDRLELTDPDVVDSKDAQQWRGQSGINDSEVLNLSLQGGTTYAFSVNDYNEHFGAQNINYQPACFTVSLTPQ